MFIFIKDDAVLGSVVKFHFASQKSSSGVEKYTILAQSAEYIDPTFAKERFISTPKFIETKLLRLIADLEDKSGIQSSKVVICLPNSAFYFQKALINYEMPIYSVVTKYDVMKINKNIIAHFLEKPGTLVGVENFMHTLDDSLTVRSILGLECSKVTSISLATSLTDEFKIKLNYLLKSCDLNMEFCMPISHAITKCYSNEIDFANGSLLLYVDYHEIAVNVINGLGNHKICSIPLGIHAVVIAVAQALHVDAKVAYKILNLYSSGDIWLDNNEFGNFILDKAKLKKVINKSALSILHIVQKELQSTMLKTSISKVIISGKFASIPGVQDVVQNAFNIPCVIPGNSEEGGENSSDFDIFKGAIEQYLEGDNFISDMRLEYAKFIEKMQGFLYSLCNKVESII